jgi:hypothetical protein
MIRGTGVSQRGTKNCVFLMSAFFYRNDNRLK